MEAIERIAGYACEVNEEQWREFVKVADEAGVKLYDRNYDKAYSFMAFESEDGHIMGWHSHPMQFELIPYPDFLAKLKGEEKWEPKNGEEVEVSEEGNVWRIAEFVAMSRGRYVVWLEGTHIQVWSHVRPLRPTITRAEAEHALGKRIVD